MPGSIESHSITLEFIDGHNLQVPSKRMPAGIYISINVDSRRRWNSAIRVLSSDKSVAWGDSVNLSSHESPALPMEIRASFEQDRTLGNGEIIGQLQTSWDELLDHGDEPFKLSFLPVRGVNPSLTLKATVVHASDCQDGALLDVSDPILCPVSYVDRTPTVVPRGLRDRSRHRCRAVKPCHGFKATSDYLAMPQLHPQATATIELHKPWLLHGETAQGFMIISNLPAREIDRAWKRQSINHLQLCTWCSGIWTARGQFRPGTFEGVNYFCCWIYSDFTLRL
ncbi:hypothetical protein DEU56DRAFT_213879 [Suillus clintonianus]|uniref:uncharacterized protein n=1 Tax=Suillus clintonianus TaxID=1904413 RepID=UPI001B87628C|nr:uncharacterized protein DEU56DRAFT_213879 [Suillus clintonianus]KAG2111468.1 hypothetical protein DEU56DRAFT_213879 [Suillus clintonianus]